MHECVVESRDLASDDGLEVRCGQGQQFADLRFEDVFRDEAIESLAESFQLGIVSRTKADEDCCNNNCDASGECL